jgi:hypothetical protein
VFLEVLFEVFSGRRHSNIANLVKIVLIQKISATGGGILQGWSDGHDIRKNSFHIVEILSQNPTREPDAGELDRVRELCVNVTNPIDSPGVHMGLCHLDEGVSFFNRIETELFPDCFFLNLKRNVFEKFHGLSPLGAFHFST